MKAYFENKSSCKLYSCKDERPQAITSKKAQKNSFMRKETTRCISGAVAKLPFQIYRRRVYCNGKKQSQRKKKKSIISLILFAHTKDLFISFF